MIPIEHEARALAMYRRGDEVEDIHRALWPGGNRAVSHAILQEVLRGLDEADQGPPPDDLPDHMRDVEETLADFRDRLRQALAGESRGPDDAPADPVSLNRALCDNVRASIEVSRHRLELQKHRRDFRPFTRRTMRRTH